MNKITILIIMIMIISSVNATSLAQFPNMFIKEGAADVTVVIGKAAAAEDVIGAIGIVVALQHAIGTEIIDVVKLDSEVGALSNQNLILVGGPCANAATAKILGYPTNCLEGFEAGRGDIRLYEFDNGNVALMIAGAMAIDTRRAANIIANYKDHNLTGTELSVTSRKIKDTTVITK